MLQLIKTAKSPSTALANRLSYEQTASACTDIKILDEAAKMLELYPFGQPWLAVEIGKHKHLEFNQSMLESFEQLTVYFMANLNPPVLVESQEEEEVQPAPQPYVFDHQITTIRSAVAEISALIERPSDLEGVYAPDWSALKGRCAEVKKQVTTIMAEPAIAQLNSYIRSTPHNTAEKRKARQYLNQFGHLLSEFFDELDKLDLMVHASTGTLKGLESLNPLTPSTKFYLLDLDADI